MTVFIIDSKKNPSKNSLETEGLLKVLLAPFIKAMASKRELINEKNILRLQKVITYIMENLKSDIKVSDLSAIVFLEHKHFSKLFKKTLGISPYAFILQQRVKRVQRLLIETDYKLEQLAEETGFTDAFHLSKTFHRITGITPSGFRNRRYDIMP